MKFKFELNNNMMGKIIGISLAAAMAVTVAIGAQIINIKDKTDTLEQNNSVMAENQNDFNSDNTTIVPFDDKSDDNIGKDTGKLKQVYDELVRSESLEQKQKTETENTTVTTTASTTVSTTASTAGSSQTVTTTSDASAVPAATASTTAAQAVSNGKREFNYEDVSAVAADLKTLENFVEALSPTSFCWDASEYSSTGYVKLSLLSAYGNVTLDVKPALPFEGGQYTIEGQVTGGMNSSSITEWDWYVQNKNGGCNICSVTWLKDEFAIAPVRGVKLGTSVNEVTESYLCVNGGANTLYKASDVLTEQNKLNALLASENAYTFVGGRIYSITSYLEKYYSGKQNAYRFADCDYVIQYGCNSIMDYNYTTGSWIIEYAINDDKVAGITFMNKSYYEQEVETPSKEDTASTTSSKSFFEQLFGE